VCVCGVNREICFVSSFFFQIAPRTIITIDRDGCSLCFAVESWRSHKKYSREAITG
jgi:hypothetical protein